ncbi:MAG TPA: hypothetical protein VJ782_01555 [Aeromicrobium sp.]|nr:hypothetical protein [Aeromicrobium sp.]
MSTENDLFVLNSEATGKPFQAKVGDKTLSFTHSSDLDQFALAELLAADIGDLEFITGMFKLALSDEDLATLRAANPNRKALTKLFVAYKAHNGLDVGESPASSD